jgi:hypothetical protein
MPARFAREGHVHDGMDQQAGTLDALLELSARHERDGLGDAPWPPHYQKQPGEPSRVQPSRRRQPVHPLVEVARAQQKADALVALERWKARHPEAAAHLAEADVLEDRMRGRFRTWTRIRVNLQHVPAPLRPQQEALDLDDVVNEWGAEPASSEPAESSATAKRRAPPAARAPRRTPSRARKES